MPGSENVIPALFARRREWASVFQPIMNLGSESVVGYEALLRVPSDLVPGGPAEAFSLALTAGNLVDLELAAFETHLNSARGLSTGRLFLNLSASAFLDPRLNASALVRRVREAGFVPMRVVLELTEAVRIADAARFADSLTLLREEGFQIAVDDFGSGFSSLQVLVELGPDYVKLDRSLIEGACENPRKRLFLESIGALGLRMNCTVIAEGVETENELDVVRSAGIRMVQGWAIARPAAISEVLKWAPDRRRHVPLNTSQPEARVGLLVNRQAGVPHSVPVALLLPLFEAKPEPAAIPVLVGSRPAGIVTKHLLFFHLGHQFGFSLHRDRPVERFLTEFGTGWDSLPADASVEEAADVVRRRPASRRYDPVVIVTADGDYAGLLPVDVLLAEMTRLKVDYALQSNPLTRLPGSYILARTAEAWKERRRPFCLGWADLDNFKPFNDYYGFSRGDEVLLLAADVLSRILVRAPDEVLANPGGDDFAFLISPEAAEVLALQATREFSERVQVLYDEEDRERGFIVSADRRGEERNFDFVSISIGLVIWDGESDVDTRRLVEVAAEMKNVAKKTPGPAIVVNRRSLDEKAVYRP